MVSPCPGSKITRLGDGTKFGSICCFVTRGTQLYALTAAHVPGAVGQFMRYQPSDASTERTLGKCTHITHGHFSCLDAALIEVNDSVARTLTAENFKANGIDQITTTMTVRADGVPPPNATALHAGARSCRYDGYGGQHTGSVSFAPTGTLGGSSAEDELGWARLDFSERDTRPGDSGGPVYKDDGTLIGFVSIGIGPMRPAEGNASNVTRIMACGPVMRYFGCSLAQYAPNAVWMPPPEPDDDLSSDDAPDWWPSTDRPPTNWETAGQ